VTSPDFREQMQRSLGDAYTIERELGGGGMSRVFLARDVALHRQVVVKVLPPDLVAGVNVERFRREILVAAGLQHPHIVPVLASGEMDGLPWFTMPFIKGESLRARLDRGPFPLEEAIGILREVAKALSYAHEHRVVHRDIKPDNVLLTGDTAVVTDFGIAKALSASRTAADATETRGSLTQVGMSIGTPMYMAPEQAAADPATDARADLYSFGCLAYELLTGRAPFTGRSPQKLLAAHMGEAPAIVTAQRPDTPPALATLVMQCLEKEPSARPRDAAEIVRALGSITSDGASAVPAHLRQAQHALWKVLAIWMAMLGAVFVLAKAAIVSIGLPNWVLPGALIVVGAGLPVILATYWINRIARREIGRTPTLTPGGTRAPAGTMATMALRAAPVVTWHRAWVFGAAAIALFMLGIAGFMTLRSMGIGPAGSLLGKGVLQQNDRVVIAQFSAPDTSLGGSVSDALRTELAQSKVVTVVQPSVVRQTLLTMQRAENSPLIAALAQDVAQRAGAKAVITGDVSALGSGYLLKARLVEPKSGDPLATFQEIAKDPVDVLAAIGRLSKQVREKIGESLRTLQNLPPVERVTTTSLQAFRKYNEAIQISEGAGDDPGAAYKLLLEAIALDSTFAMAYRKLAWQESNPAKAARWATKAWQNRARLTDVERYQAEGMYHWLATGDLDEAIEDHRKAFLADSTVPRNAGNLTQLYSQKGDWANALIWADRLARFDSSQGSLYRYPVLVALGRDADAQRDLRRQGAAYGPGPVIGARFQTALVRRQFDSIASIVALPPGAPPIARVMARQANAYGDLARGRLRMALARMDSTSGGSGASGSDPSGRMFTYAYFIAWFLGDTARARITLDSATRVAGPAETRGANFMLYASNGYSLARVPRQAKEWLARYEKGAGDSLERHRTRAMHAEARGWLALAEGRTSDAVSRFREALDWDVACRACVRAAIGAAYDAAKQTDSTLAIYQTLLEDRDIVNAVSFVPPWEGLMRKRSGELFEERGDRLKALASYRSFVDLMKDADVELQPGVRDVRTRIARLEREESLRR
jgi:eukaryotic-like serine/threonine-protein kinase